MLWYNTEVMGIILALLSAIGIASGNVLLKKSFKDFSPAISFFIFSVLGLGLWLPFGLIEGVDWVHIALGLLGGVVSAVLGQLAYIWVLSKGELSITATILSTYSIYTIILSVLFNGEHLSTAGWLFVALAIGGTVIVSLPEKLMKQDIKNVSFVVYAAIAALCVGSSDGLTNIVIHRTSVGTFFVAVAIAQFVISFIYLKVAKEPFSNLKEIVSKYRDYRYAILGSLTISVGTLLFFLSFHYTLASIASPINSTYPVITILLALIFLKDKITPKNWLGLGLVITAVLGISFF